MASFAFGPFRSLFSCLASIDVKPGAPLTARQMEDGTVSSRQTILNLVLARKLPEAERLLDEAPQDDVELLLARGWLEMHRGNPHAALEQYKNALRYSPEDPRAHCGKACVYDIIGHHGSATDAYADAQKHDGINNLLCQGARNALQDVAHNTGASRSHTYFGLVQLLRGRFLEAKRELFEAKRLDGHQVILIPEAWGYYKHIHSV